MPKKYNLNTPSGFTNPSPCNKSPELNKIMFYFGECHSKYQLTSSSDKRRRSKILDTIHICCQRTAMEFMNTRRENEGGTESIPINQLKRKPSSIITPDLSSVISIRAGKSRIIGELTGNIFIVFFVDYTLELYDH